MILLLRWLCGSDAVIGSTVPRWNAVLADRAAAATERLLLGACGPARPARDAEAIAEREARLRAPALRKP